MYQMMSNALRATCAGLAVAVLLAACATETPYKPVSQNDHYGYSETRLTNDRYRIVFTGNASTKADATRDFALLRASELTLQTGGDWFQVVGKSTDKKTEANSVGTGIEAFPVSSVYQRCGMFRCQTAVATTPVLVGGGTASTTFSNSYSSELEIVIGKNPMPDNAESYDAHQTASSLRRMLIKQ